jgi:hypothetical protein
MRLLILLFALCSHCCEYVRSRLIEEWPCTHRGNAWIFVYVDPFETHGFRIGDGGPLGIACDDRLPSGLMLPPDHVFHLRRRFGPATCEPGLFLRPGGPTCAPSLQETHPDQLRPIVATLAG